MPNFDQFQLAVEGNGNKVLYDDKGLPSVMVPVPRFNLNEINPDWPATPHPAFLINDTILPMIYISKYQNVVDGDRAYSLPMRDPRASITFDVAKAACEAKGRGWHLMTNAEWAAIALWCRKNNLMPRGNNNYGEDVGAPNEKGVGTTFGSDGRPNRVATGSGPVGWSHDGTTMGIWDLNGNVYEWVGGYRTMDGEIQIIPQNNSALALNETAASTEWKAILQDGSLVAPGTVGTLKWDYTNPVPAGGTSYYPFVLSTQVTNIPDNESASGRRTFESLVARSEVTAPDMFKHLGIFPADSGDHGGDYIYMRNIGERLAFRGGGWHYASDAGVFNLNGRNPRSYSYTYIGFRSAFVELP